MKPRACPGQRTPGPLVTAAALIAGLTLNACASHGLHMQEVEKHLAAGDPAQALSSLDDLSRSQRDRGLRELDRGMLLRMNGDLQGSIEALEAAKDILGELEAISLTETAGALMVSERTRSYAGDVHERVLLHVYQALNFLETGQYAAARVEAQQIDLGLRRIDNQFGRAPHGGDAFARYLAGLIYERNGEYDDALIALRKAFEVYELNADEGGVPVPRDLLARLNILANQMGLRDEAERYAARLDAPPQRPGTGEGEIMVVVHHGLAPARVAESINTHDPETGQIYRISLPRLAPRGHTLSPPVLRVNGRTGRSEKVEDITRVAQRTLDQQLPALTARAITRNITKHHASQAVREESELLGFLVNIAGAVAEEADTRSWRTLPADIYLARIIVPAGTYTLELEPASGSTTYGQALEDVRVEPGSMTFRSLHRIPHHIAPRRRR